MHVFMHICNVLHFTKSLKTNQDNSSRGFPQRDFIVQLLQRPRQVRTSTKSTPAAPCFDPPAVKLGPPNGHEMLAVSAPVPWLRMVSLVKQQGDGESNGTSMVNPM